MNAKKEQEERPAVLKRRPRAASDERIDPISYTPPVEPPTAVRTPAEPTDTESPAPTAAPATSSRGGYSRRRQPTVQLGVRVAVDVSTLIDEISDEEDITARAVVENAVRAYAKQLKTEDR